MLLLAAGLFITIKPRWAWYLTEGWTFKNAEPSDGFLILAVFIGLGLILAGLIVLF